MSHVRGFTLIDLAVALAVVAILGAFIVPKFLDFGRQARIESTRSALGAVRSVLSRRYLDNARMGTSQASYPGSLSTADFPDRQLPFNQVNGRSGAVAITGLPTGTSTSASAGFWYVTQNNSNYGRSGAYSDGAIDTSTY